MNEPNNYQIVDDDDNVLEDNLTLFEAEVALTRWCNEGVDAYLQHKEWMTDV